MKNIYLFFVVFAFSFAPPTKACDEKNGFIFPSHSPNEIIESIKPFMHEKEIQIDKYVLNGISYNYMKSQWYISYEGKNLTVGDHFSIIVKDDLKGVKLVPGL